MHKLLLGLALMALVSGCSPAKSSPGQLPFYTIERKADAAYIGQQQYDALGAGLFVISSLEEAEDLGDWFGGEARASLAGLDWGNEFAIAVFQGWQGTEGFGVDVHQVLAAEDAIRVVVNFMKPQGKVLYSTVTSPYHLVAVRRPVILLEVLNVELVVDGEVIFSLEPGKGDEFE